MAAVVVCLSVVGCTVDPAGEDDGPEASPTTPQVDLDPRPSRGTLRIGLAADPHSIDPRFLADEEGEVVVGAVFEPLVRLTERDRIVSGAAARWEVDDEGRVFTFELREARFHDGTTVTPEDVKRTFDRLADGTATPPSSGRYLVEPILGAEAAATEGGSLEGVRVTGERTLEIELASPDPRYLLTLADPALAPTPEVADTEPTAFAAQPVGNGPFRVAEAREPGAFIRLTRVAEHHRAPRIDEVVFQIYPDDPDRERQWRDLSEGLLQVADLGPERRAEAVERYGSSLDGRRGPGVLDATTSTVTLLAFDLASPPFDDPAVRRAISQSIDRDALADEALGGAFEPAEAIVPPAVPGAQPGVCDHCRYDPEGAAALLDDSEVDLPPVLTLVTNRGPTHAVVARAVADDVRDALGVIVRVQPLELAELSAVLADGQAPWFRLGWEANEPDPGAYLGPLFGSASPDNLQGYVDEEVDELLAAARSTTDAGESSAVYAEVERRVLDDVAVAPLLVHRRMRVVTPEVRGLEWTPSGRVDLARVTLADPS